MSAGSSMFTRCEHCRTEYRFERLYWHRIVACRVAVCFYTFSLTILFVSLAYLMANEFRSSMAQVAPDLDSLQCPLEPSTHGADKKSYLYNVEFLDRLDKRLNKIIFKYSQNQTVQNAFMALGGLSIIQLMIVDGNVMVSFNLLFAFWRLYYYGFKFDHLLCLILVSFGMTRMVSEIHRGLDIFCSHAFAVKIINYHAKLR